MRPSLLLNLKQAPWRLFEDLQLLSLRVKDRCASWLRRPSNRLTPLPQCRFPKRCVKPSTCAVSLFARLPTPALLAAEVTFTVTLARCSSPWFLVEKRNCLQSTTDHASNGPKIRRIECKICCNFLKQALKIERIPGDEMYPTLKEFGKRQKNLRASHLLLPQRVSLKRTSEAAL